MKCRFCNSKQTRVTVTEHQGDDTWRYCRCLDCNKRFKTIETYVLKKRGAKPGSSVHVNHIKKGETNGSSVLLETNVKKIRELAEQNVTYKNIAEQFGIHQSTVYRIIKRKLWAHV